jgi:hypothetical protein
LGLELLFDWPCHAFPFHTLAFTLWLTVVNPRIIPTDNAYQECLTFVVIVKHKALADCQMVAFVLSCEVPWNPWAEPCITCRCWPFHQ